jgi:flagellar hook-associated protein 3 FlgL
MSLLPVVTPRTSHVLQQHRLTNQVNSDQIGLQRLYDQLSTGRRVLSGSDDPAAATRALGFQYSISQAEQMSRNANIATGYLQSADSALGIIDETLINARGTAIYAVQNVLGEDERALATQEIEQAISRLFSLGNESFRDSYLFGGVLTDSPPLKRERESILFSGNEAVARASLANDTKIETLPTGANALGLATISITGDSLSTALTSQTRLVDMRGGRGIEPGVIRLTAGSGWTEVDLRGSVTIGDIAERISGVEFEGRQLAVDIGSDSITVRYADNLNGTLGVADAPGWSTATQLNISNPQAIQAPPLIGGGLAPKTRLLTPLADLNDGAGIDVSAGFQIRVGENNVVIDLSQAETLDDVITEINRSGADVMAELNEVSGAVQLRFLRSGVDYSVGENGSNVAESLGLRTDRPDVSLQSLLRGRGLQLNPSVAADLTLTRPDGRVLEIDVASKTTVGEILDAINQHPDNQDNRRIVASLAAFGNGIQLRGPVDTLPIRVQQPENTNLGTALGLIPAGETEASSALIGGVSLLVGQPVNPVEPGNAVDTLLRLQEAVRSGDAYEIERLTQRMDGDFDRASRLRGLIGSRGQVVDALKSQAEDQTTEMKARLSEEVDADFTETISEINIRQASMQASLQLIGKTAGLTVLDFL